MIVHNLARYICGLLTVLSLAACGGEDGKARISLNLVSVSESTLLATSIQRMLPFSDVNIFAVNDSGQNTVSQLAKYAYYFVAISLCEDVTYNGSAFSDTNGCVEIYGNSALKNLGDLTTRSLAEITATGAPIDLMDPTSLATLNQASSATPGSYKYAVITWAPYVLVNATVTALDGTTDYRTLATGLTHSTSGSRYSSVTADLQGSGSAEDVHVINSNGGTFYRFTSPFVLGDGDSVSIDLAFNPDGIIKAGPCTNCNLRGDNGSGIEIPMLQLSPVPRTSGSVTKRRVYTIAFPDEAIETRLELYYLNDDLTKIYGVNSTTKMLTGRNGLWTSDTIGKISKIETSSGRLSLYTATSGEGELTVSNLDPTVTTTGSLNYQSEFAGMPTDGSYVYTYVGDEIVAE